MKAWEIVSETLKTVAEAVKPGVTTKELDEIAEAKILELGGTPYNKGYKPEWAPFPFPATLCTSVNYVIAHGVPSSYKLKEGDIINLDVGVKKDGLCGDAGMSVPVGEISNRDERLLRYTKQTLYKGIEQVKAGAQVKEIGIAMERHATQNGYKVNFGLCGHGIGKEMHQPPNIPNVYLAGLGEEVLKAGDMICIEPMLTWEDNLGTTVGDGWGIRTKDGKNSAQFEHQILVKEDGYEILTTHITDGRG